MTPPSTTHLSNQGCSLIMEQPQQGAHFYMFTAKVTPTLTHLAINCMWDVGGMGTLAASLQPLTRLQRLEITLDQVCHETQNLLPAVLPALTQLTQLKVSIADDDTDALYQLGPCPGSLRELSLTVREGGATTHEGLVCSAGGLPRLARLEFLNG